MIVAAPGPSLTAEVAEACRGSRVIAVNDAYRLFPFAEILYAADLEWWSLKKPKFAGRKVTCSFVRPDGRDEKARAIGLEVVKARFGRTFNLSGPIHYGRHSGFQAINLALQMSSCVILVGFDMRGTHFFGAHKKPLRQKLNYTRWHQAMNEAARTLPESHRVINATPDSALECFPKMSLAEALNESRDAGPQDCHSGKN